MKFSNLFFLLVLSTSICCANIIEIAKEKSNWIEEWIQKERELTVPFNKRHGTPELLMHDPFPKNEDFQERFCNINKQSLSSELKKIIYMVFFQEMGIISGDFSDMAQGNADLAQDLQNLCCVSFNQPEPLAQEALDKFCNRWNLEKIEVSQAHTFGIIYE